MISQLKKQLKKTLPVLLMASLLCACTQSPAPRQEEVTISIWTYYNGAQLTTFNELVKKFNSTVGAEEGIIVESTSIADIDELGENVLDSAKGKVGAEDLPNIFSAYAETAYALDQLGMVADLAPYLTEDWPLYVGGFLQEGCFSGDGTLKIFPVAKSTEVLLLDKTDWDLFAQATGASYDDLATIEGITATAQAYYEWTDSLTPEANDGKAFFGRDAMANYLLVGALQLGEEIFQVHGDTVTLNFDRAVMKQLWDNYYVPFVKGYFAASGRFRSDDIKTGNIVCYVGSSSSAAFFPDKMILDDGSSYPIQMEALPCPQFENGLPYAVQQGAGMVVTTGTQEEIEASVRFLKWFTQEQQNVQFSAGSGYLPVTKSASDLDTIRAYQPDINPNMERSLAVSLYTVSHNALFTLSPFEEAGDARAVLECCMSDLAVADRAVVEERLQAGMSLEDAAEEFLSEEYFDAWYLRTTAELEKLIG